MVNVGSGLPHRAAPKCDYLYSFYGKSNIQCLSAVYALA